MAVGLVGSAGLIATAISYSRASKRAADERLRLRLLDEEIARAEGSPDAG